MRHEGSQALRLDHLHAYTLLPGRRHPESGSWKEGGYPDALGRRSEESGVLMQLSPSSQSEQYDKAGGRAFVSTNP